MKPSVFFALLSLPILSTVASAEPVLTWDDCERIAVDNNPDQISAQRSVEANRAQYKGSYNGVMPKLNLSSSYNRFRFDDGSGRWGAGASATWDIFDQSAFANIHAASAEYERSVANYRVVSSNTRFGLRQAFTQLLYAQKQIDVSKTILEIRDRNSKMVNLRYNSGRESKGNMMRAKAELLSAKADLEQSYRDLRAAQQELGHQLGEDEFVAHIGTGTLTVTTATEERQDFKTLVDNHPTVRVQLANVETALANVQKSKSALWPTLSANYNRSYQGPDYFPTGMNWTASGVVRYPLFAGGPTAAYYSVSGSKRALEGAEQNLRSTRNQVLSNFETVWANLVGAEDQVTVQTAFLEASRQQNGEADIRYSNGLLTYENWEQIVTTRVTFEQTLVRAQRDAVVAEAQWMKALGKELQKPL